MKKLLQKFRKIKRKLLANHLNAVRATIIILVISFVFLISNTLQNSIKNTYTYDLLSSFGNFLFTPTEDINTFDNRTNLLLLGKAGGENNDSPELTDTIIVVSIKHDEPRDITLISVPRDIWVPEINDKINAAYKSGNEQKENGGLVLAKSAVEKVVGLPLHYSMVVDFGLFEEVINIIDGVEIEVEKSFVDEKYPIAGLENDDCNGDPDYKCRYETIQFIEGLQKMNGETALKYSRSRHSEDLEEGTDLARARRQQQVLSAIKNKVLSSEILYSPNKVYKLWKAFEGNIETDLTNPQIAILARRVMQARSDVSSQVIPEELLLFPGFLEDYDFLYVFTPAREDGSWSDVHAWVAGLL